MVLDYDLLFRSEEAGLVGKVVLPVVGMYKEDGLLFFNRIS